MPVLKTKVQPGEKLTSDKLNQIIGASSYSLAYDNQGRVSTVTDTVTSTVYTFSYNADETIDTITDGDNTWEFSYNNQGQVTSIDLI